MDIYLAVVTCMVLFRAENFVDPSTVTVYTRTVGVEKNMYTLKTEKNISLKKLGINKSSLRIVCFRIICTFMLLVKDFLF